MSVADEFKLVFNDAREGLARMLGIAAPTTGHRIYKAFNKLAKIRGRLGERDQGRFDTAFSEKLTKASPDWHFFDSARPDSDDLSFNFAVYSSVRVAGSRVLGGIQLRDHLKSLADESEAYAEAVSVFRERVADLELVAEQMSGPRSLELESPKQPVIVTGVEMEAGTQENRIKKSTVLQKPMKVGGALRFKK